jgi:hypothetical protein
MSWLRYNFPNDQQHAVQQHMRRSVKPGLSRLSQRVTNQVLPLVAHLVRPYLPYLRMLQACRSPA